jgi:putative nucleotidyltransferase with HDIG domain
MISVNSSEMFKAQYNENLESVKEILHDISAGKSIDIKKVQDISSTIYARINENRDIVSCINQIRSVDEYTYTHCINVSMLSMMIARWMKYDTETVNELIQAGLLHDIGKGRIDPEIINKPGMLTKEEFEEMRKHALYGYMLAEGSTGISENVRKCILMHHEREDGTGYPLGARGSQIHHFAKIVAVADIYDAMTSNRSYKQKDSPFDVFYLMENSTFGVLDTKVVRAFLSNMAAYYIGDFVRLNTGDMGEIVYINPMRISQPIIRVNTSYVDLSNKVNVKIAELV